MEKVYQNWADYVGAQLKPPPAIGYSRRSGSAQSGYQTEWQVASRFVYVRRWTPQFEKDLEERLHEDIAGKMKREVRIETLRNKTA